MSNTTNMAHPDMLQGLPPELAAQMAVAKTPEGDPTKAHPESQKRVNTAFQEVFKVVFETNQEVLQTDNPFLIAGREHPKGTPLDHPDVLLKVQDRKAKRALGPDRKQVASEAQFQSMPVTTDAERTAKEQAIDAEVNRRFDAQIRAEPRFQSLPEGNAAEIDAKKQAVDAEIARRKELQELQRAADIIYTVNAAEAATTPEAVNAAVAAENARLAVGIVMNAAEETQFRQKFAADHQGAATTVIDAAVVSENDKKIAAAPGAKMTTDQEAKFREQHVLKYKTPDGGYYVLDDKGQPTAEVVRFNDSFAAIDREGKRIAAETVPGSSPPVPTDRAKRIQPHSDALEYSEADKGFKVRSEAEALQAEIKEDQDRAAQQLLLELDGRINGALPADIFTRDASQNITGVDQAKLRAFKEKLAKEPIDETTGRWIIYLGSYYEATTPKAQARLAALIAYELKGAAPDRLRNGFHNANRFNQTLNEMVSEIESKYHIKVGDRSSILDHLPRNIALAIACKGKVEAKTGRYVLPDAVNKLLAKRKENLTPDEVHFIGQLASYEGDIAQGLLGEVFCLNTDALSSQEVRRRHADNVLTKILDEKGLTGPARDAHQTAYGEVMHHNVVSDEKLREIAKRMNFSGNLGNLITMLLILGPSGLSVMGFDVTDDEQR